MKEWIIVNDEGETFCGVADSKPVFGEEAAVFDDESEADKRAEGLTKKGLKVEVGWREPKVPPVG